jgi:hypothetical protein
MPNQISVQILHSQTDASSLQNTTFQECDNTMPPSPILTSASHPSHDHSITGCSLSHLPMPRQANTCHTEGFSSLTTADILLITSNCNYRSHVWHVRLLTEPHPAFPHSGTSVPCSAISDFPLVIGQSNPSSKFPSLPSLPLMGQPAQNNQIIKSGWQCFVQDSQAWQMGTMQKCVQSCLTIAEPNMRLETGAVTETAMKKHRHSEFITSH